MCKRPVHSVNRLITQPAVTHSAFATRQIAHFGWRRKQVKGRGFVVWTKRTVAIWTFRKAVFSDFVDLLSPEETAPQSRMSLLAAGLSSVVGFRFWRLDNIRRRRLGGSGRIPLKLCYLLLEVRESAFKFSNLCTQMFIFFLEAFINPGFLDNPGNEVQLATFP